MGPGRKPRRPVFSERGSFDCVDDVSCGSVVHDVCLCVGTVHGLCLLLTSSYNLSLIEPRSEKTGLRGFRPGLTQTELYNHTRWLEA